MAWTTLVGTRIEVVAFTQYTEQIGVNVLQYQIDNVAGAADSELLADLLATRISTAYKPWMNTTARWLGTKVTLLTDGIVPGPAFSTNGAGVGTGGAAIPRQLAGLIQKRANIAGPKGRGRFYAAFPGAATQTAEKLSAGGEVLLTDIITAVYGLGAVTLTSGANTWTLGMYIGVSRTGGNGFRVSSCNHIPQYATQKRRGYFGRPNSVPAELA